MSLPAANPGAWVIVIGGTVLDIHAQPLQHDLRPASTVPGKVSQLPGGVGRNIAEAATTLLRTAAHSSSSSSSSSPEAPGEAPRVQLISAVGDDAAGASLLAACRARGMSTACIQQCPGAATACVSVINDRSGEVAAAVADVELLEQQLTPALLSRHAAAVRGCRALVLDANLGPAALAAACAAAAEARVPVVFEPVSVPKSTRCVPFLPRLAYITPNAQELLAIAAACQPANSSSSSSSSHRGGRSGQAPRAPPPSPPLTAEAVQALPAAQQLAKLVPALGRVLQAGLGAVVLTMGAQGAALVKLRHSPAAASGSGGGQQEEVVARLVPAAPVARVVNVSGAGDCLAAAFAAALAAGADEVEALALGVAAGAAAVACSSNVPTQQQGLEWRALQATARGLLRGAVTLAVPLQQQARL